MGDTTKIEWADGKKRRYGPAPHPPRHGDKVQARQRINVEVRTGKRPHPNDLPCTDCGHIWTSGTRHEYDHYLGYAAEHHYHVQPVCTPCHAKRGDKARKTHCLKGHEYTPANTIIKSNGCRQCRECRKAFDRNRGRDASYWRQYRINRSAKHG